MKFERELVPVPVKRQVEEQTYATQENQSEVKDDRPKEMPKRWYVY